MERCRPSIRVKNSIWRTSHQPANRQSLLRYHSLFLSEGQVFGAELGSSAYRLGAIYFISQVAEPGRSLSLKT